MGVAAESVVVAATHGTDFKLMLNSSTGLLPDTTLFPPSLLETFTEKPCSPKFHMTVAIVIDV